MPNSLKDYQIIQACLKGETNQFDRLVSRYQGQLMRFLNVRCANHQMAEDIFQETFINALKYLHSYNSEYAFSTWLFRIAINLINAESAKHKDKLELDKYANNELSKETTDEYCYDNSNIELNSIESNNIWREAKRCLKPEQLELLWFTYVHGLSGKQVALILERSLPWVKINLARSKKRLKMHLTNDETIV